MYEHLKFKFLFYSGTAETSMPEGSPPIYMRKPSSIYMRGPSAVRMRSPYFGLCGELCKGL